MARSAFVRSLVMIGGGTIGAAVGFYLQHQKEEVKFVMDLY